MNPGARRHPPPQVGAGHPGYRWGALPDEPTEGLEDPCDDCERSWMEYVDAILDASQGDE